MDRDYQTVCDHRQLTLAAGHWSPLPLGIGVLVSSAGTFQVSWLIGISWERAAIQDQHYALAKLYENTNTVQDLAQFSPLVNMVIDELHCSYHLLLPLVFDTDSL